MYAFQKKSSILSLELPSNGTPTSSIEADEKLPLTESGYVDWRSLGYSYYPLKLYFQSKFGTRVQKISLDGGFTCPNVDGTVATGGCTFCDNKAFSPSRRVRRDAIASQIERGISGLRRRYKTEKFLAYFQPATNTYGDLEKLRVLWETALEDERVVGLVIGTRPDCIPDDVLELVDEFAEQHYVSLELGIQTIHDSSLDWMNRGHHNDVSLEAMERTKNRKFEICLHIMLGLPGETHSMMMATARQVAAWSPPGVKIHNLYAVENTPLANQVRSGEVRLQELDEYLEVLADFLELLPPEMVIERISGDAPPSNLVAPKWCLQKGSIIKLLNEKFERRESFQGSRYLTS